MDIEAEAEKLREVVARALLESQLARAQEGGGDTGQGEAAAAARVDAERETGRGGTESAAQPGVGAGGGGGAGGGAQERPASQREGETLVLEPPRAGSKMPQKRSRR